MIGIKPVQRVVWLLIALVLIWGFTVPWGSGQTSDSTIVRTLVYHEITSTKEAISYTGFQQAISDNGNRAAFLTTTPPDTNHIYVTNFDGTDQREIDSSKGNGRYVEISADGSKILSWTDYNAARLVNADGTDPHEVIYIEGGYKTFRLAPDGSKVFFMLDRDAVIPRTGESIAAGLYVINSDGTNLRQIVGRNQIAALFSGMKPEDVYLFRSTGSYHWFDVSGDSSRIVFAIVNERIHRMFHVNLDGTGLQEYSAFPEGIISFENHLGISSDGTKVFYDISPNPCCSTPAEVGVMNFDGSSRKVLISSTSDFPRAGGSDTMYISADGSKLLLGSTGILLDTSTGETLQLALAAGTPWPVAEDVLNLPSMDNSATRFVYFSTQSDGRHQLATLEINPANLGEAPSVSDPNTDPNFVLTDSRSKVTLSARVSTSNTLVNVGGSFLRNGLKDPYVCVGDRFPPQLLDDGTQGDVRAGDGVFTNNNIIAFPKTYAIPGPRTVRVKAEVSTSSGKRHATAVDFEPFEVSETPTQPTVTPRITPAVTTPGSTPGRTPTVTGGVQPTVSPVPPVSPPTSSSSEPASVDRMTLQAGVRRVVAGSLVNVPVYLIKGADVANMDFTVSYDANVARSEGDLLKGYLLDNALFESNTGEYGIIRAAFAQNTGVVSGTGPVAYLPFRATGTPGTKTALHLEVPAINDPTGTVLTIDRIDGSIEIISDGNAQPWEACGFRELNLGVALCALQMSVQLIPKNMALDMNKDIQVNSRDAVIIIQRRLSQIR